MSGHSHWAGIKHKKEIADSQKSKAFSKLAREIEVSTREGGKNPDFNPRLRTAIERAKELKMPKELIEKAIKRGAGEIAGQKLETFLFEALGPEGIAILIEGITDNKNRALSEIKQTLQKEGGKLVSEGSLKWMFERKGCLTINPELQTENYKNKEDLELVAIEAGAQDLYWHNNILEVYTKAEDLERVRKNLQEKGIKIESSSLDWVPKEEKKISEKGKENCQKLFKDLDELDSVQEIYSNLESQNE